MLKHITEPQAQYQKQGMPAMPAQVSPSSAPLPFNKLPQKSKFSMKVIGGVIGLALVLAVGVAGIMTAQKQKQLGNTAVAPNAPESQPSANYTAPTGVNCGFCSGSCVDMSKVRPDSCSKIADPSGYACVTTSDNLNCIKIQQTAACVMSLSVLDVGKATCTRKDAYLMTTNGASAKVLTWTDPIVPGSIIKYVITVDSTDATKNGVTLTDTLDPNLTFDKQIATTTTGAKITPSTTNPKLLTITLPAFTSKSTQTVAYTAKLADVKQPIPFKNMVTVTNDGTGAAGAAVSACSISLKSVAVGTAACTSKTAYRMTGTVESTLANTASIVPGEEIYYRVTVTPSGTTSAPVQFKDILPKGISFVSVVSPSGLVLNPKVETNGSTTLTGSLGIIGIPNQQGKVLPYVVVYKAKVAAAALPGDYKNSASVLTGSTSPSACAALTLKVPPNGVASCVSKTMHSAPISEGKTDEATSIKDDTALDLGKEFYYRFKLTASSLTAGKVLIKDVVPNDLEIVDKMSFEGTDNTLTKSLAAFKDTQVLELKVRVRSTAKPSTVVTNTASVTTYKADGTTALAAADLCESFFKVAEYSCNTSCTSDAQCKTANNDYVCDAASQKCRAADNTASESCEHRTFACNTNCDSNEQCSGYNSNYKCATISTSSNDIKRCRLASNEGADNCQPPATSVPPTAPPTATPAIATATPTVGCNQACKTNADCTNSAHVCYTDVCRLDGNVESTSCSYPVAEVQPTLPQELPQTGPEDWINWLKAGLVTLGIGAALLLLL